MAWSPESSTLNSKKNKSSSEADKEIKPVGEGTKGNLKPFVIKPEFWRLPTIAKKER